MYGIVAHLKRIYIERDKMHLGFHENLGRGGRDNNMAFNLLLSST